MEQVKNPQVLVVIDMQNDFLKKDGALFIKKDTQAFQERVAKTIENFVGQVILTKDYHTEDSAEFDRYTPHCLESKKGGDIVEPISKILKKEHLIILKPSFCSDVVSKILTKHLNHNPLTEFIFAGLCTHICVHDTVSHFYNMAIEEFNIFPKIILRSDLLNDYNDEMAKQSLYRMQTVYGAVVSEVNHV
jgi:nicotinamidase/pyrazinamidase